MSLWDHLRRRNLLSSHWFPTRYIICGITQWDTKMTQFSHTPSHNVFRCITVSCMFYRVVRLFFATVTNSQTLWRWNYLVDEEPVWLGCNHKSIYRRKSYPWKLFPHDFWILFDVFLIAFSKTPFRIVLILTLHLIRISTNEILLSLLALVGSKFFFQKILFRQKFVGVKWMMLKPQCCVKIYKLLLVVASNISWVSPQL